MTLPFPDFFVVGAPRCGTTSLCRYLARHPRICFSRPKEPHYLTALVGPVSAAQIQAEYVERCFAHRTPLHQCAGEGSVSTLYSQEAIARILALRPDARFVVQVRNPFDMLRSYHQRLVFLLEEDQPDLAVAWSLQAARARGERLPRHSWDPRLLQYAEVASLGSALERIWKQVGREGCHVVVFDDLVADPRQEYERTLAFLGVPSDGCKDFPRKQRSRAWRHLWLQTLLFRPPRFVARAAGVRLPGDAPKPKRAKSAASAADRAASRSLLRAAGRRAGAWLKEGRQRLVRYNQVDATPAPLSPELRAEIARVLDPEIRKLGELLGRDLSHWK